MDFDDHDDPDDEIGHLPGGGVSSYDTPSLQAQPLTNHGNSSRSGGIKTNSTTTPTGIDSGHRRAGSGSGGRYRECLKNHAVSIGGHAVDGCGEFMPAGEEGTLDALKCAACNCHRNFHRKEVEGNGVRGALGLIPMAESGGGYHNQQQFSPYYRTPSGYLHHHHLSRMAPPPLALPSTSGGGCSRDEQEDLSGPMVGGGMAGGGSSSGPSKKRFRTKFTQEQKDKMLEFAERLGWRMQKHDEAAVQQFCAETGVQRHVLKVWMHNNKHTLGKAPAGLIQLHLQQERDVDLGERNDDIPGA